MRITNNITTQSALRTLQRGQQQIAAASERVTTGLRFQRASEDPMAAAQVMRTDGSLRALTQYRRNIDSAAARTAAEEGVLDQLVSVLTRATELGISQATATANGQSREIVKAEVDQLLRFTMGLANTRFGDAYLFGGDRASEAPFTLDETDPASLDFTTSSPTGQHRVEIAQGQILHTTHDGSQVFGTVAEGPLAALRDLARALAANDQTAIGTATERVRATMHGVNQLIGEVGARTNQLQITAANLQALDVTLTTFKADVQEVDFEAAVTELVGRQTAFQAAMLATSRIMGMNLTDYIR